MSASTRAPGETGGGLEHGGRLGAARRRFPDAPLPFLDLSTGINPVPYTRPALPEAAWCRLPEPEADASLAAAAAAAYGVADPAMVVAAPGTQLLIGLLPHLLPQAGAVILGPTYGEHRAAWAAAGKPVREAAALDRVAGDECAVLCNPNNPDGRRTAPKALTVLADRLAAQGGVVLVDEAFADFDPAISLAAALPHPALVVLRSFGKAYGLAGLRLGFALAAPDLAARLRGALGPWAVSGPAASIGTAALADAAWRAEAAARLARDTVRLDAMLTAAGLRIVGGTALFRLAATDRAPAIFDRLGRAGILVRRFADQPAWLRFGLPGAQPEWDRLDSALRT